MKKIFYETPGLFISISQKSGMFGTIIHNAGFTALNLNYFYKAFAVNDLEGAIQGIRSLGIKGCSVSMPFKEDVIKFLDNLDPLAKRAQSVNTIVNSKNHFNGYNTEVLGVEKCLKSFRNKKNKKILLLGAGGLARAVLVALENLNLKNVMLTNRTKKKGIQLSNRFNIDFIPWSDRNDCETDIIINTTSVGMYPAISKSPLTTRCINNSSVIMDAVANPQQTKLLELAKKSHKITISGLELAFFQGLEQFKLYTGKNPPIKKMQNAMNQFYGVKK